MVLIFQAGFYMWFNPDPYVSARGSILVPTMFNSHEVQRALIFPVSHKKNTALAAGDKNQSHREALDKRIHPHMIGKMKRPS